MNILSIGIDNTMLDKNSKSAHKMIEYGDLVDSYCIVVPAALDSEIILSPKVLAIGVGGSCKPVKLLRMYRKLKSILATGGFDAITVQDPFETAFIAWILSRKYNVGLNIQEHGDFFSECYWRRESVRNFFRYYLGRFLIKRADSVRAVSKKIKDNLINKLGIDENRIIVVPVFSKLVERKKDFDTENNDRFVFLWIGRFEKQKNFPLLFSAFLDVIKQNKKVMLCLVGCGSEQDNIERMVDDLKIGDNVEISGWVDDVDQEYRKADAYVLPSFYEGWGRVVIEAMQNGVPVVMTRVGCADEVVVDGENGIVVPIEDKDKLAVAMIQIQDKRLREKFVGNLREALDKLLNKEETLKLYRRSWEKARKSVKCIK